MRQLLLLPLLYTLYFILYTPLISSTRAADPCQDLQNTAAKNYCQTYNNLERQWGDRFLYSTDEEALLSQSYTNVMQSYVDMYLATHDLYYLDRLSRASDIVLSQRDDNRGVVDYSGQSAAGWRCKQYSSNGEYYRFLMHSGSIITPMLRFAEIVKNNPSLPQTYQQKANLYIQEAKKVVAAHDVDWRTQGPYGYYIFGSTSPLPAPDPGSPLPHNQQLTMGSALVLLAKLTGEDVYKNKAMLLAKRLDDSLFWTGTTNAYHWPYGWTDSQKTRIEDISHGGLDVGFVIDAYSHQLYFTQTHLNRFINTLHSFIVPQNYIYYFVDGSDNADINQATKLLYLANWIDLASVNPSVYFKLKPLIPSSMSTSGDVLSLLSWAKYTKYANQYEVILPLPGDLDGDDHVNIFDFNKLVANFGNPYTIFDFNAIVSNYGQ